ncbi:DUF1330 domain-containing protein [Quatrionicoccus australiensis]|uniref:DUF1330 domain-containing protein n=1 Tax=Quatrionicoccus australiensis TaxID=138118 RepID=UPI001CFBC69C|nr:DUF1330 domain-containing protein [Quatrionicoccus australiensis]MCB4361936.1 DUF1330 domain-containing protein [Quatrionicoccus australiensis]
MAEKGYIVAEVKVHDANAMARYRLMSQAAVEQYGGRFLVRGGAAEILEGKWTPPQRMIVVEFDTVEQAKRFYDSAEYQAARKVRENAAEMNMLVIAGVDSLI